MSKFNTLMENHLQKTDLVRIRIKYDPANGIDEQNDYVGYVLEEDGLGNVIAIVPGASSDPMSLGPEQFEIDGGCEQHEDPLARFKQHLVKYLMNSGFHDKVSENMELIINTDDISHLEGVIQSCGCDGTAVLNLYRDFVTNGTV